MTCDEVRATISGTDVFDQTPSTILAVTRHIRDCEACDAWRTEGLAAAKDSLDKEYGQVTTDALIAESLPAVGEKMKEIEAAFFSDSELRCQ